MAGKQKHEARKQKRKARSRRIGFWSCKRRGGWQAVSGAVLDGVVSDGVGSDDVLW
jgi:endonuclease YncB( thermonuclease family)